MTGSERDGDAAAGPDLVGFGEAMVLVTPADGQPLESTTLAELYVAGAELNVCAAAARLGARTAFASRLGDDPFGVRIRAACTELGIGTDLLVTDPAAPTGVYFKDIRPDGQRRVHYYRARSAASTMDISDAERVLAAGPAMVAVSGITASLSPTAEAATGELTRLARAGGVRVALDPNLRPALGPVAAQAERVGRLLSCVDILILGLDEAEVVFGTSTAEATVAAARSWGIRDIAVKAGPDGCYVLDGDAVCHLPSAATVVVDPVGAGDAFAGGYLVGRSRGLSAYQAAWLGTQLAGRVVGTRGDTDGLPSTVEASRLLATAATVHPAG